jgi:hypothetical protein
MNELSAQWFEELTCHLINVDSESKKYGKEMSVEAM